MDREELNADSTRELGSMLKKPFAIMHLHLLVLPIAFHGGLSV